VEEQSVEYHEEVEAFDGEGRYLGVIEAIGMGRDRVPRRVGVRSGPNGSPLRFFPFTGARLDGSRVILGAPDRADRPLSPARADARCSSRI
jgi:hypothetical protein